MLRCKLLISANGTQSYFYDGKRHRVNGPAIIHPDGATSWWKNGRLHRYDGPAIQDNGYEGWYINGKCHRLDGPAIIYPRSPNDNGDDYGYLYYIYGQRYFSKEEWEKTIKNMKEGVLNECLDKHT